jgi:methyltransferase (TIGR00027 family)
MTTAVAQPSRTAMLAAVARGVHRTEDPPPLVFDDPYALPLVGPGWEQMYEMVRSLLPAPVVRQAVGLIVGRSRFAEDALDSGSFGQHVVLGAGLDSFAWRRSADLDGLRVFEVDQPATQEWKRARAASLSLPHIDGHAYVPCDLENDPLAGALGGAGFDWTTPSFFSCLGLTIYLGVDTVEAVLRTVAACPPGSAIALSYSPPEAYVDPAGRVLRDALSPVASAGGEDYRTLLSPDEVEELVRRTGLTVVDHPTGADLHDCYFGDRGDGLTAPTSERLMVAGVPQSR